MPVKEKKIKDPGAKGGKFYINGKGNIVYGEKPSKDERMIYDPTMDFKKQFPSLSDFVDRAVKGGLEAPTATQYKQVYQREHKAYMKAVDEATAIGGKVKGLGDKGVFLKNHVHFDKTSGKFTSGKYEEIQALAKKEGLDISKEEFMKHYKKEKYNETKWKKEQVDKPPVVVKPPEKTNAERVYEFGGKYGVVLKVEDKLDLESVDSRFFDELGKRFENIDSKMPEGFKVMDLCKSIHLGQYKEGSSEHGTANIQDDSIRLNMSRFKKDMWEDFQSESELKSIYDSKFHSGVKTMNSISTFDHEMAHMVHNKLIKDMTGKDALHIDNKEIQSKLTNPMRKEVLDSFETNAKDKNFIRKGLSEYATADSQEFFAEAFMENMGNPTPRPIATKFWEVLNERMNPKKPKVDESSSLITADGIVDLSKAPTLEGSFKQNKWAWSIRNKAGKDLSEFMKDRPQEEKELISTLGNRMLGDTSSKGWIENRELSMIEHLEKRLEGDKEISIFEKIKGGAPVVKPPEKVKPPVKPKPEKTKTGVDGEKVKNSMGSPSGTVADIKKLKEVNAKSLEKVLGYKPTTTETTIIKRLAGEDDNKYLKEVIYDMSKTRIADDGTVYEKASEKFYSKSAKEVSEFMNGVPIDDNIKDGVSDIIDTTFSKFVNSPTAYAGYNGKYSTPPEDIKAELIKKETVEMDKMKAEYTKCKTMKDFSELTYRIRKDVNTEIEQYRSAKYGVGKFKVLEDGKKKKITIEEHQRLLLLRKVMAINEKVSKDMTEKVFESMTSEKLKEFEDKFLNVKTKDTKVNVDMGSWKYSIGTKASSIAEFEAPGGNKELIEKIYGGVMDKSYLFPTNVTLKNSTSRGSWNGTAKGGTITAFINSKNPHTLVHEIGHAIEDKNPNIMMACDFFKADRTNGFKEYKLSQAYPGVGYGASEVFSNDSFADKYAGKNYDFMGKYKMGGSSSEILTMGIQELRSSASAVKFYIKDPNYFAFTHGIISKNY